MSTVVRLLARTFTLVAHAVWLGGFTFYSTAVLRVLDAEFGTFDTGLRVTRPVTDWLNGFGVVAVASWWGLTLLERGEGRRLFRRLRVGLLALTTALLAFLIHDHRVLDRHLDEHGRAGFYAIHSVYLVASTAQFAVNLLLLAATLRIWDVSDAQSAAGRSS